MMFIFTKPWVIGKFLEPQSPVLSSTQRIRALSEVSGKVFKKEWWKYTVSSAYQDFLLPQNSTTQSGSKFQSLIVGMLKCFLPSLVWASASLHILALSMRSCGADNHQVVQILEQKMVTGADLCEVGKTKHLWKSGKGKSVKNI